MKFVITGSLGNISKPLAQKLVEAGHQVTVISSQPERAKDIENLGAKPAIGNLKDIAFLAQTFQGADAVYTMVPPNYETSDYRQYFRDMANSYAAAIKSAGVKRVVNLSSIGAHLPEGTGPIKGLHDLEQIFSSLDDVAIVHLRPAYFYTNYYANIDMIRHAGILGSNYPADANLVMAHPSDIADVAAELIQQPITGKTVRYIASDEISAGEATKLLGSAIDKPELPWVEFSDEQSYAGMVQAGLSEELSRNYTEMGNAVKSGILFEDYKINKPELSKRKFKDFAGEFASAY
ncbi:NAD(P)H-binding protein [Daejeonella lutea]|uniref:Uncharacterized conserved protein YbjT, contains NAD(P)-binding and DUF2867 domains n=1 Tax=Daejeonella lutea TaxID=572036 RepID=A0A1T5AJE7_9SPHI|nr:NAD(P)H-binding protein [Daejeonella lutea]SKB35142.1 Uncharacterized conserved protein YbjT, contains NAD(P)-binding and DUF2867 domains [Daejeonella lutea]